MKPTAMNIAHEKNVKRVGSVEIQQEAFLAVLKVGDSGQEDQGKAVGGYKKLLLMCSLCGPKQKR